MLVEQFEHGKRLLDKLGEDGVPNLNDYVANNLGEETAEQFAREHLNAAQLMFTGVITEEDLVFIVNDIRMNGYW